MKGFSESKILTGLLLLSFLLIHAGMATAQNGFANDVPLFQNYYRDTPIAKQAILEPRAKYRYYKKDHYSIKRLNFGTEFGAPICPWFYAEIGAYFENWCYAWDGGDSGESGMTDLHLHTRHKIMENNDYAISVGGGMSVPIGSEDVGYGNTDFFAYGAGRYSLSNNWVLAGNVGVSRYESGDKYETGLSLGFGSIIPVCNRTHIVGEMSYTNAPYYKPFTLSAGINYNYSGVGLRGMVGMGLNDDAPDFFAAFGGRFYLPILQRNTF